MLGQLTYIQGGLQKLLLITKESIISNSIFFWTTLYTVNFNCSHRELKQPTIASLGNL